jgi:hypothetical protein
MAFISGFRNKKFPSAPGAPFIVMLLKGRPVRVLAN